MSIHILSTIVHLYERQRAIICIIVFCHKFLQMRFAITVLSLLSFICGKAQVDTINTDNLKLNISAFAEGKSSFAVFFEDSLGNRLTSADIWDRSISISQNASGQKAFRFEWKWYRKDTLITNVVATGLMPSLKMLTHDADYKARGNFSYLFTNGVVTVPEKKQRNARDSSFRVVLNPAGFEFPMDLEIFPLLPFKKVGQEFAIAFYEPGSAKSNYYHLTVTGREDLPMPGAARLACWMLRIDYAPGSYADFWISDKSRQVVKMREYFKGRFRYKVRLY